MFSFKPLISLAIFITLPFSALCMILPVEHQSAPLWKRGDMISADGTMCVDSSVGAPAGMLFCYDGEGNSVSCSDCMKATSATVNCVITSGDGNNLGTPTACPGDPAPATRPDGSPNEIADGLVKTFCNSLIGWPGPFGFIQPAVCLAYSYAMANGDPYDEALEGATSLCDTFTIGVCTFFGAIAPMLHEHGCEDPPDHPGLCTLAGSG